MTWIISGVSILVLFVLQLSLADLNMFGSAPNLVLVYAVLNLAYWRQGDLLFLAIGAGLLLDFFSAMPDGVMIAGTVLAIFGGGYLSHALFSARLGEMIPVVRIVLATIIFFLAIMLVNQSYLFFNYGDSLDWNYLLTYKLGADVVLNLLFLYPVHLLLRLEEMVRSRLKATHELI